jgi:putative phosphoesterase
VRLAVVSDVHGNLGALEAVVEDLRRVEPDVVVHGGDLALMGSQPAAVVDLIRELAWQGVVGNVDELLWRPEIREREEARAPKLAATFRLLFEEYRPPVVEALGDERIEWMRELPAELEVDGVRILHASPGDLWRAPMPDAADDELVATYGESGVVAYGHIHRPFVRSVGDLVVANAGSAGAPLDGDPRASYLLIDDGVPQVVRVEYDVAREAESLRAFGYADGDRLAEMRITGRFVRPD